MEYIVISDFDGTITMTDTVDAMAEKFAKGDFEKLDAMWKSGKYDGAQISQEILDMLEADEETLKSFIKNIKIDPYFKDFIEYIKQKALEFYIVSDGFDFNIETVLEENNIEGLMSFSNILEFKHCRLRGLYPNRNEDCGKCGNCKRNLIQDVNLENKKLIYIGDGHSDRCASLLGDYVFAKGSLAAYLKEKGKNFIEFSNFKDIIKHMEKM